MNSPESTTPPKTWLTADWHLGEDRFEIMQRPFDTAEAHFERIMWEHNWRVGGTDLVYVVGDACYQKAPQFLEKVNRLNGRKILLRGNHDRVFTDEQLAPYFEKIIPEGESLQLEVQGIPCSLNHYPSLADPDRFNLVGHIHGAWKFQLNALNVGVDVHHFRPVNLDQIPFYLKAISEYYDDDVWSAYLPANAKYVGQRGKKGNYFTPSK